MPGGAHMTLPPTARRVATSELSLHPTRGVLYCSDRGTKVRKTL